MKRALSFALSLLLILMMIPLGAFTAGADFSLPINWFVQGREPAVVNSGSETSAWGDVCNWTLYEGGKLSITGVGWTGNYYYNAPWGTDVTEVIVDEGITSIGYMNFTNCTKLTKVTLPSTLTEIGNGAFSGCTALTSIVIPASVTNIGMGCFENCTALTSVKLSAPVNIQPGTFGNCVGLGDESGFIVINGIVYGYVGEGGDVAIPKTATSVARYALSDCQTITGLTIHENVADIGEYAFASCRELVSLTIEKGLTAISSWAFGGCIGLTEVVIPDSVTEIGTCAFYSCTGLTRVTVPSSVTNIGDYAFSEPNKPLSATFRVAVNSYAERYFSKNTYTKELYEDPPAPSGVTGDCTWTLDEAGHLTISGNGPMAHYSIRLYDPVGNPNYAGRAPWGTGITSVTVEEGVTAIGAYAFYGCAKLTSVTLPDSVDTIWDDAFHGCTSLTGVTLPRKLTVIKPNTFRDCASMTDIDIPDTVTTIETSAFQDCSGLTNIVIPDPVTSIGNDVFSGCTSLTGVTLPSGITAIPSGTFRNCTSLTSFTLPDTVTEIGGDAFRGSGLTSFDLPDTVTKIGDHAFLDCVSLTSVTGGYGITTWQGMGFYAFKGCTALADEQGLVVVGGVLYDYLGEGDDIVIPSGTWAINSLAYLGSEAVFRVTVPASVTYARNGAFRSFPNVILCVYEGTYMYDYCTHSTNLAYEVLKHAFSDWTQTKAPTCTDKGAEEHTCLCGETETRDVDALGHDYSVPAHKDAAGRMDGYDGHTCSRCGELKVDAVLPATGIATDLAGDFDWDNEVTDEDAIWLLMYTFFPEDYPIADAAACDYDGDGEITDEDAIWLLMYTFFPDDYPIV